MAQLKGRFTFLGVEEFRKTKAMTLADLDDGGRVNWSLSIKGDVPSMERGEKYYIECAVMPGSYQGRDYLQATHLVVRPAEKVVNTGK
jgi:hypothetical protein